MFKKKDGYVHVPIKGDNGINGPRNFKSHACNFKLLTRLILLPELHSTWSYNVHVLLFVNL